MFPVEAAGLTVTELHVPAGLCVSINRAYDS